MCIRDRHITDPEFTERFEYFAFTEVIQNELDVYKRQGLMSEPIDIRKYEFISMPVKEEWGAFVREDSPLVIKDFIEPKDLIGIPLILSLIHI